MIRQTVINELGAYRRISSLLTSGFPQYFYKSCLKETCALRTDMFVTVWTFWNLSRMFFNECTEWLTHSPSLSRTKELRRWDSAHSE